jgi:hypothetical protein
MSNGNARSKVTGALPAELGGWPLTAPVTQRKYQKRIPVNDELDILLRGVPDCLDGSLVYEWKSGLTSASNYVDSLQTDVYKLLIPHITEAVYVVWNPYTDTHEVGVKSLKRSNAEAALDFVLTFGLELIDYLKSQRLLKNYEVPLQWASSLQRNSGQFGSTATAPTPFRS